nr:SCO-spondin-like [Ciona intestinalis]|eukprot:XP_018669341.1 SCO-spondin-like [Ciona intestinalis]
MLSIRLITVVLLCSLHLHRVEAQACTDQSWCQSFAHFCTNARYAASMRTNCPNVCGSCPSTGGSSVRCGSNNGECEHLCHINNDVIQCSCHPGYELASNGKNCTDVDECATMDFPCPNPSIPYCVNLRGNFQCSNQSCRAISGQNNRYQSGTCCQQEIGSTCGRDVTAADERIVGGKSGFLGGWPWMVYILIDGSTLCGGTLIDENWVLTAAHCFRTATASTTVKMYFGRLNPYATQAQEPHVQIRDATQLILHEQWDKNRFPYNDIALLRVSSPVVSGPFISKVCLPNGEVPPPGARCWVTGYGTTAYRGPAAKILREVQLPIVDINTCARSYNSTQYPIDTQKMLCAGYRGGGRDACQGDSGGPLVCQRCDSCSWYIAGVVSYGKGCASPNYYGVYTKVEMYEEWINTKTNIQFNKNRRCTPGGGAGWTQWASWQLCTQTCGTGSHIRRRTCVSGTAGGPGCRGNELETQSCNTQLCPSWGVWAAWGPCDANCGAGERMRSRPCLNGNIGDVGCEASGANATEPCNTDDCPTWSVWSGWSTCTAQCGGGTRTATRTCNTMGTSNPCSGSAAKSESCSTLQCPTWNQWVWSVCSRTCGGGTQMGTRTCNQHGGTVECDGDATQTRSCETQMCPRWGRFGAWQSCSVSCGGGTRERSRPCMDGEIGDIGCPPQEATETEACNEQLCGTWEQWSPWSTCSLSCNGGRQTASRQCTGGTVGEGGCPGSDTKYQLCQTDDCPSWAPWSAFNQCSKSCASGTKTRSRNCNNGNIGDGGCNGDASMTMSCNTHSCPHFSEWSPWAECSRSCNNGTTVRERTCIDGVIGDQGCIGQTSGSKACNVHGCPFFTEYTSWSACNASCGGGHKSRTRTCENGNVGQDGCVGDTVNHQSCNVFACASWSDWSGWTSCSATCGSGTKQAVRICLNANSLTNCEGSNTKVINCQRNPCPGEYTDWSTWSECSTTCGPGTKTRHRNCTGGSCNDGLTETENCLDTVCVGEWTAWTPFTPCSKSCGLHGYKTRSRQCLGGGTCSGPSFINTTCGVECLIEWASWGTWGECDRTCSGGTRTKSRSCNGGSIGSAECPSNAATMVSTCNETPCPDCVDGAMANCAGYVTSFTSFCYNFLDYAFNNCPVACNFCHEAWGAWSTCTFTCGGGAQVRTRSCRNLSGRGCKGSPTQTRSCNVQSCSGFTQWSMWSQCTVSCDGGNQYRTRECPSGIECPGDEFGVLTNQTQGCGVDVCPGRWGDWASWPDCPASCGQGQRRRERQCVGGVVWWTRMYRRRRWRSGFQIESCQAIVWGPFVAIGTCSATCGNGTITSNRVCNGGDIGGPGCEGGEVKVDPCNLGECVVAWQPWGPWGECNVTCGGGVKVRTRLCDNGMPGDVGCEGLTINENTCNLASCAQQDRCSGLVNLHVPNMHQPHCLSIITWCTSYTTYMNLYCRRACCEYLNAFPITLPACEDNVLYAETYCAQQTAYCTQSNLGLVASAPYVSFVRANCAKTCRFCRPAIV